MINYNDGTTLHGTTLERPRTDVRILGTLAALNSEVVLNLNGESSASFDIRGTFVGTFVVEGSDDGTNFISVAFYNPLTEVWTTTVTAAGSFDIPNIAAFRVLKIRCSAFTSGSATVSLNASLGNQMIYSKPIPTTTSGTILSTANTTATLTLAAPGVGLYHYITAIRIERINNSAAAITGTALLGYTTTNLTGSLAFSSGNAIAAGDSKIDVELSFAGNPLKSTTANTATTIVAPAGGAGVQIRMTAFYYIGA